MKVTEPHLPLPNPGDWCTLSDAATALKLSRTHVWRMVRDGILPVHEVGDQTSVTLVWRAQLAELVEARRRVRGKP